MLRDMSSAGRTSLSDVDVSVVLKSFSIVEAAAKMLPSELLRT